ncbi:MAG: tRNA glutamyl-Q(34) synthetase GluQRS [Rhodospirillaceae bacterium]|nr:tRNA glutamyl-Q(34) synthetase GluQRS [Rhodospirillaceae bacterium]|tara:strand:+ start:12178 stop:13023 length:846 start_codon:yes stop_codon:yes gene_type:complete
MTSGVVTRFAPSPTGYLHIGHAFSALFAYHKAKITEGRFILRIEDIDRTRCKPEFEDAILEDLSWLGIEWEEPVRRQSAHLDDYDKALDKLTELELIYPCFCTRGDIKAEIERAGGAPHGPEGPVYPGTCRHLSTSEREKKTLEGEPFALRIDSAKATDLTGTLNWFDQQSGQHAVELSAFGDVVLARKDIRTSYHLAVTVDDGLQGVTLITRGKDLADSTNIHRVLQSVLGYEMPTYHHHRILTDNTGKRFAKRDHSITLRALRKNGHSPEDIRRMVGLD